MKQQAGLTIVEFIVSMALGLVVIMAALSLLLATKSSYLLQDESVRLQETGRYVLESIARAVRQTAYENWNPEDALALTTADMSAPVLGLDARSLKVKTAKIDSPLTVSGNNSDVLALRFFGSGYDDINKDGVIDGDSTMLNCAGFSVPAPTSAATADEDRGWSIFYVGESELRCKYRSKDGKGWAADAIATGVESFQVWYGIDTDNDSDGLPNTFLTATEIGNENASHWKRVAVIKVELTLRGTMKKKESKKDEEDEEDKDILRKTFSSTIQLRNRPAGSQI